jgi:hypothetical protein
MPHRIVRHRLVLVVVLLLFTDSPFAAAQERPEGPGATPQAQGLQRVAIADQDARETREDFDGLLRRLPPEVGRVMRLDPSLMRNEAYLAPYPALGAFLQQHPEVVQNPRYYLEHVNYEMWNPTPPDDAQARAYRAFTDILQGAAVVLAFGSAAYVLLWLVRTLIDYRRWYRVSKVQTEVHTKLMDRFTSNEDLMAYMQTPAGRRFLESAPIVTEGAGRAVGAPLSRILWSLQVGIVLAVAALGIIFVSSRSIDEIAQPLFGLGVLVLALGTGFVVSAAASYLLSRRLGLLDPPAAPPEHTGIAPV